MSNLFLTLVIAFVVIVLGIAALAIGWLITGKTKTVGGSCGCHSIKKQKQDECSTSSSSNVCDDEKKQKHDNDSRL